MIWSSWSVAPWEGLGTAQLLVLLLQVHLGVHQAAQVLWGWWQLWWAFFWDDPSCTGQRKTATSRIGSEKLATPESETSKSIDVAAHQLHLCSWQDLQVVQEETQLADRHLQLGHLRTASSETGTWTSAECLLPPALHQLGIVLGVHKGVHHFAPHQGHRHSDTSGPSLSCKEDHPGWPWRGLKHIKPARSRTRSCRADSLDEILQCPRTRSLCQLRHIASPTTWSQGPRRCAGWSFWPSRVCVSCGDSTADVLQSPPPSPSQDVESTSSWCGLADLGTPASSSPSWRSPSSRGWDLPCLHRPATFWPPPAFSIGARRRAPAIAWSSHLPDGRS